MEISRAIRGVQRGVLLINEHLTNFLPRWPHEKRSYTPLLPAIETRRKDPDRVAGASFDRRPYRGDVGTEPRTR